MVSTRPSTSESSSLFNNRLVTVPKAPITIGIIFTFMFHSFFNSLARSWYLSLFSLSFSFIQWSIGKAKSTIFQILSLFFFLFFLLIIIRSGLLVKIRWSVCLSKSHIIIIIIIIIIYSSRVFHISIGWWFFTGVWVTASLPKSPGLVSVF